jgi:DNA-binding response OmpR family regulator
MVRKVVSIEDEPEIAELLRVVLFSPEIELHHADSGGAGLVLIRRVQPDLIVLDLMLPGELNGWQVYDTIRADAKLSRTPVIILSVLPERPERRRAFEGSEIDLYITKPFDTLRLRKEIERMVNQTGLWRPPGPSIARAFEMPKINFPPLMPDLPSDGTPPDPAPPAPPVEDISGQS